MKIAVEGCAHGELDMIYSTLENIQRRDNINVDLLLCCGDFQAVRNEADLSCMAVPPKYRQMCSFYKYYNGEKKAPVLTVFIGGNHEASNHLWELPFGGWVAPNIYYLGYSGVVNFGGLRIAGLSGIYKAYDYNKGHYESPPFNQHTIRSIYHVRSLDAFKLKLLSKPVDIVMSHDWPKGVYYYGNLHELYQRKAFLKKEIETNTLGSPAAEEMLRTIQPDHWFSAHLHCRFPAKITHSETGKITKFLALDKCLPRRKYLEVIDVGQARGPLELSYDAEWLAITKCTMPLMNADEFSAKLPRSDSAIDNFRPTGETINVVRSLFNNDLRIPANFTQSALLYNPARHQRHVQVTLASNPQTDAFCQKLKIRNPFWTTSMAEEVPLENPDEISLSDDGGSEADESGSQSATSDIPGAVSATLSETLSKPEVKVLLDAKCTTSEEIPSDNSHEISLNDDNSGDADQSESQESDLPSPSSILLKQDGESVNLLQGKGSSENKAPCDDSKDTKPDINEHSKSEPPRKIFKLVRRNQAVYSTTEDSDD